MATVEITFERGLRIWWSYTWRALVLLFPVLFLGVMLGLPGTYSPDAANTAAAAAAADPMAEPTVNPFLMMLFLAVNLVMQVQALRWTLKTRWRDFHLQAVANQPAETNSRDPRQEGGQ